MGGETDYLQGIFSLGVTEEDVTHPEGRSLSKRFSFPRLDRGLNLDGPVSATLCQVSVSEFKVVHGLEGEPWGGGGASGALVRATGSEPA